MALNTIHVLCFHCCLVAKLCPTLLWPPGLWPTRLLRPWEISQARVLEWVAISFFRASSWPRDSNPCLLCLLHWQASFFFFLFYHWATKEALLRVKSQFNPVNNQALLHILVPMPPQICPGSLPRQGLTRSRIAPHLIKIFTSFACDF